MEYDSESSLEGRHKSQEKITNEPAYRQNHRFCRTSQSTSSGNSWRLVSAAAATAANTTASAQTKIPLGTTASRSLSSQVMEYYQKYSQNSNLNQYFSLSTSTSNRPKGAKYYYNFYELSPKYVPGKQSCTDEDYSLKSYIPRERRRWVRPPLIGQSSTEGSSIYVKSMTEPHSGRSKSLQTDHQQQTDLQQQQQQQERVNSSTSTEAGVATEEKSTETTPPLESSPTAPLESTAERKASSPTSSVASHKPLEWDSGADVGYLYASSGPGGNGGNGGHRLTGSYRLQQLSTIERMALARGCSAALRLDPEGTTEQQQSPGSVRTTTLTAAVVSLTTRTGGNGFSCARGQQAASTGRPDANSTPLLAGCSVSGSESEIEITPIVKSHVPGIVAGEDVASVELAAPRPRRASLKVQKDTSETPKSANIFKLPLALKYCTEDTTSRSKTVPTLTPASTPQDNHSDKSAEIAPLKKSSSMNLLASPTAKLPLKRSQSELNLCGKDKTAPKLIFNSTSSIATVVNNKPITCNKLIQTSMRTCKQESVGVQVSVCKEEEKPPLPKRATSLVPRSLNSILKNSKNTYKVVNLSVLSTRDRSNTKEEEHIDKNDTSSDSSQNASLTPQADDTENVTGRANSFEYFPGHIYENVPNGSTSHVSSVDTGRSNSTMPNTSSSIDEKLWGDSDSLVRDLERSVNILKSLVDANKFDKQVKKRLIHHVVKRLITTKYTDDKIEHNLEENVPWNPADARNKIYRAEIIQALAKNTTDSSDDWKPTQKKKSTKKTAPANEARPMKEMINMPAEIESSNSDKLDRNTDRTVMDGRKARMGLRADDCGRCSSSNTVTNKSESSECFLPQRGYNKNGKMKDMFVTSTTNSSPQDQNRALLEAVVNSRRSPIDSSNEAGNSADWRLPATMSERRYELRRCSNSDSGDTKLVSYAEMEKRNQLIWITNEISHLSNLKKLLEQPKTKHERHSKSSSSKSKHSSSKPHKSLPSAHQDDHRHQNGDITGEDGQLNKQWSSHCNLVSCPPLSGTSAVRRLKKRNSCTQTATDSSTAYSRTGSEIVSAKIQIPNMKLCNMYVQTSKPPPVPVSSTQTQVYSSCPVHRVVPLSCTCSERICLFCKLKNPSHHHRLYTDEERDDTQSEDKFGGIDSEDTKQTKNQLNTTKLKCTCEVNDKLNMEQVQEGPTKSAIASQTCDQYCCEDSMCPCRRFKLTDSLYQSLRDCECEKLRMGNKIPPRKKLFEKSTNTNCACECKKLEEVPNSRRECSHHNNKKAQPCCVVNLNREAHPKDCCYGNKIKDRGKTKYPSPKNSARDSSSTSSECKCCWVCGVVYQNDRKCGCAPKSYPKAVAYELSFVNDGKCIGESETGIEVKSIDKNVPPSTSRSRERVNQSNNGGYCACEASHRTVKRCDCDCRENKSQKYNNEKKCTLQEYLVSNNPVFADNVETRRQYVSEIHRLRQLRKDRRVQLLAMASTASNLFAPTRPTKATKSVQKKISDEDMKSRLRKRYFQLSEVRAKRRQQQLQEEARCNKLMAKIFCKKLQQKVLRGQVDLSQSVSVISNL